MRTRDYVARRLLLLIPVLIGISLITFTLSHMIGDPVAAYVTEGSIEKVTPERIQAIIKAHGLDQPIYVQYAYYIRDILQGDWGISKADANRPVTQSISTYFPATMELTITAVTLSLALGIPLGIVSATKKDKLTDHAARIFSLTGVSMPVFWFGLMLQYVFFYTLKVNRLPSLPLAGRVNQMLVTATGFRPITGLYILDSILQGNLAVFADALLHLILPAFALAYISLALIARMMRSSMLEVLRQDYITLARSKGLPERVIIYKHALKNAIIPTVTVAGLAFGGLLAGAVLTETVFNWPGMGRWSTSAILRDDIAAIMGFTLVIAVVYVFANLIVDLMYAALDPRIRLA
jgi:peptide/nickel transport system permease protein